MSLHLVPRSLQYFEQVALQGSIQAASRELGISASAIQRQIVMIEESVGEALFERDPKGMILTPTGRLILDLARDWRLGNARLWSAVQANRGIEHGHIRIAAMDGMVNGLVPTLLRDVSQALPKVYVDIDILSPDNAVKGILQGDYDLSIVANAPPDRKLVCHWKEDFPLGCIVSPQHVLAGRASIFLEEFISHPVVFQSSYISIRKHLEARHGWIFEKATRAIVANSPHLIKVLAASGDYIALTSELDAASEIRAGLLEFIPVEDENALQQTISVISNVDAMETDLTVKVISMAVQNFQRTAASLSSTQRVS